MSTYYGPGTEDISFVPLTREQEKDLFARFYAGDNSARDEIIRCHLKLVAKLSLTCAKRALEEDDAISAGNFGMMQALECKKFNPDLGFRFASYVRQYVRGQVCAALRARGIVHTGTGEDKTIFADGATITGANEATTGTELRSDLTVGAQREAEIETAVDHEYEGLQLTEERKRELEAAISQLGDMEQAAVRAVGLEGKSHVDVAEAKGVSRQASQQAYVRGMKKLRAILDNKRNELL